MVVNQPEARQSSAGSFAPRARRRLWVVVAMLSATITLTDQMWVGRMSIYASDLEDRRALVHQAVLANQLPQGAASWNSFGANGFNIRLLTVWAAEGLR